MTADKSQSDKFKEAARELEADEDEERWEGRLKKVAKPQVSDRQTDGVQDRVIRPPVPE